MVIGSLVAVVVLGVTGTSVAVAQHSNSVDTAKSASHKVKKSMKKAVKKESSSSSSSSSESSISSEVESSVVASSVAVKPQTQATAPLHLLLNKR
ncbi:hypothetical protein H9L19_07840 [Weissella diestrammenae]|uniref:Uncharacterized protein n=1 Tax=Weissella diestrammenae TaxID=1162633 RepID=A0A7G9T588_9LACO|nr:hypothetical protein [Weissella diestrammenae]MCM0583118.1 hypothetical protein [Weissella diestrammenae]QNN75263.1 hypothetical protein H9L19_07840 [Weissella diestrammenae]